MHQQFEINLFLKNLNNIFFIPKAAETYFNVKGNKKVAS